MGHLSTYIKRAIRIALLFIGAVIIYKGLDYLVSDDTSAQTRITFHDFYEEDVDILFTGSSHSIECINAVTLSERTGKSVFEIIENLPSCGKNIECKNKNLNKIKNA